MGGIVMERKIGEEFEYNGVSLKVIQYKANDGKCCRGCFFAIGCIRRDKSITGECCKSKRIDRRDVKFFKLEI